MTTIDTSERLRRLDTMIAEGRIIRDAWVGDNDDAGRERACLLVALSPEVGAAQSASACPASVLPAWLAHFTSMDDNVSLAHWPAFVARYADVVRRAQVLDAAAWARAETRTRIAILDEADRHYSHAPSVAAAVEGVRALLRRRLSGDEPTEEQWAAVSRAAAARAAEAAAAAAASWATATATAAASWAAASAARAAAASARAEAARSEAWAAATAASWAAEAARAEEARAAAWDRMSTAALDAIETEIGGAA
jgi:hypothetical protein